VAERILADMPSFLLKINVKAGYGDFSMITLLGFQSSVWFMQIGRAGYGAVGALPGPFLHSGSVLLHFALTWRVLIVVGGDKKCDQ